MRDGLADRAGGTVDQLLLVVKYKQFYLADGVAIGKRSAVEAELKLPFAGQAIPPATCDRKEEHGQEQQQQVLQPPQGGTGICVFVFVHLILYLQIAYTGCDTGG